MYEIYFVTDPSVRPSSYIFFIVWMRSRDRKWAWQPKNFPARFARQWLNPPFSISRSATELPRWMWSQMVWSMIEKLHCVPWEALRVLLESKSELTSKVDTKVAINISAPTPPLITTTTKVIQRISGVVTFSWFLDFIKISSLDYV